MTAHLSSEPKMYEAYNNGKDLYAIIAQSAFHNNYEDNLEFYKPGSVLDIDGKKTIAGNGAAPYEAELDSDNKLVLDNFNILEVEGKGDTLVAFLQVGDKIVDGPTVSKIEQEQDIFTVYFKCD